MFRALATDYDGTLATDGRVAPPTITALKKLRASGRKLVLATGRQLPDLQKVFAHLDLFDRVVAENGALLFDPATRKQTLLCDPASASFVAALAARGIPVSVGRAIVATDESHHAAVLEAIHDLGLELHIIFNKGSLMVLPSGVNKATGLARALEELRLARESVVGIGDAENDHAFLAACGLGVTVANALPALQQRAGLVTAAPNGAGVAELIDHLLRDGLARRVPRRRR